MLPGKLFRAFHGFISPEIIFRLAAFYPEFDFHFPPFSYICNATPTFVWSIVFYICDALKSSRIGRYSQSATGGGKLFSATGSQYLVAAFFFCRQSSEDAGFMEPEVDTKKWHTDSEITARIVDFSISAIV